MDLGLRGRSCIVTGATGGIGGASARTLAAEGAKLGSSSGKRPSATNMAYSAATRADVLAGAAARAPRGRLGTDQEIAGVIAFLCSEHAANVAGAAWSVDGGAVPVII